MKKLLLIATGIILCVLPPGCIDEIDLEGEAPQEQKLVIEGQLRAGNPSTLLVQVSESIGFQETPASNFVGGGTLRLIDDSGIEQIIPEGEPGRFFASFPPSSPLEVRPGKAYKIELSLNGNVYESKFDTLYLVPKADSLSLGWESREVLNESENISEAFFWKAFVHTPLTTSNGSFRPSLKWDFSGVYEFIEFSPPLPGEQKVCYVSEIVNVDEVVVLGREEANLPRISPFFIIEEPITHKISSGYILTAFQQSLSKEAFQYWDKVSQVISRSGGFLETPPGKIQGNISQVGNPNAEVLGLFYASDVDTLQILVRGTDFPVTVGGFCSRFASYEEASDECRNCLLWPNSTYDRPPNWDP